MYHEEKVINGVLCWRGTPDGEWEEYSKEGLTTAHEVNKRTVARQAKLIARMIEMLSAIRKTLKGE